ncbi:LysE/ArgO family amino acid transporter [Miniimonas arenae]|uniref:LysE/ArgO family amino acid transporter n=1 Tax=Miniimonas arenae TaxID=676201 RepID=UPI0028B1214B|nr:LysE family transporter [Miniimonas arenae]
MTTVLAGLLFGWGLIVAIGAQNAFVLRQGVARSHVGVVVAVCAVSDLVLIGIGAAGLGRVIAAHDGVLTVVTVLGATVLLWYGWLAARRAWRPAVHGLELGAAEGDGSSPGAGDGGRGAALDSGPGVGAGSGSAVPGSAAPESAAPSAVTGSTVTGSAVAAVAAVPLTPSGPAAARPARSSLRVAVLTALALTWLNPHVYLDTVVLLGSVSASYAQPWLFAVGAGIGSITWFTALGYGAGLLAPVFARPSAWRVLDTVIAVVMVAVAASLLAGLR